MKEHFVKCWPEFFGRAWAGDKPFEIRKNDRDYAPQDRITMQEWDPNSSEYSGRWLQGTITFVVDGVPMWGLMDGFCAFAWKEEARGGKEVALEDRRDQA
jgi:hypothetical protein